jgi:hypothetical protein
MSSLECSKLGVLLAQQDNFRMPLRGIIGFKNLKEGQDLLFVLGMKLYLLMDNG